MTLRTPAMDWGDFSAKAMMAIRQNIVDTFGTLDCPLNPPEVEALTMYLDAMGVGLAGMTTMFSRMRDPRTYTRACEQPAKTETGEHYNGEPADCTQWEDACPPLPTDDGECDEMEAGDDGKT